MVVEDDNSNKLNEYAVLFVEGTKIEPRILPGFGSYHEQKARILFFLSFATTHSSPAIAAHYSGRSSLADIVNGYVLNVSLFLG